MADAHAYVMNGLERRAELAADMANGMTKVGALLDAYRAELRALFTSVAEGS